MDARIRIIAEAITKDAENNLKRLADLENQLVNETNNANEAQKKQNSTISQTSKELSNVETQGGKTNSMFSSLGKTLLAVFAVDKIIDYSKQLITLMGDTDKYRIALMNVSTSQKEYEKSLTFISKLSNDYGQNVNLLTQSYTSFIASSKSSNLTLDQRQKIYESIIKSGSALKLSNDGIEGSLRAVSQMFSKGNVSAEELRGQLGERLPGAFGIMAKAIGVTEPQLNKMLENGEVMAKDVLPKFAEELEKLYGDKAQSNLKTIGGAWNVFVNNFIEGLQDFNKSSLFIETISVWILSAANSLKIFIGWIKEAFTIGTKYNEVLNKWFDYYEVLYTAISNIVGAGWDLIKSLGQIISNILGAGDATLTFKKIVDYMVIAIKTLGSALIGAVTILQVMADAFNVALNYGKRFANFFGADFKIDPKATFTNLADNAKTNFNRITSLWNESSSKVLGTAKTTNKAIVDDQNKTTKELEKELNNQVGNNKKANDKKKLSAEELAEYEYKLKKEFNDKIQKIDDEYTKWLFDEHQKRSKIIDKSVSEIQENIEKVNQERQSSDENLGEKAKALTERIFSFYKKTEKKRVEENEKAGKEIGKNLEKEAINFQQVFEASFDAIAELINEVYEHFDKKSREGETSAERQGAALNKAFIEPFKENVNAAKALMSGDFLGAAKGVYGYFEGIWKTTIGLKNTLNEIRLNEFNLNWEQTMSNLKSYSDAIKENFEGLANDSIEFNSTQKTGIDGLIEAEIKRAGEIRNTYTLALSKEDELYQKKLKSIDDEYNASIAAINKKYDYISIKAFQQFNADSLAISEGVNKDLMAFVQNEDLKLKLSDKYEAEKGKIKEKFALAYKPITEGMSQAEINGINDAIKARDEAFAKLADWQTGQIQFVIDNGKLERDTFTDTQKIISDGKEAQYQLGLSYQAQQIIDEVNKNTEIENAEKTKNLNIETETKRHNDEVVRLGTEKDTALLNSFNALKDAMKAGYAEILAAANDAYTSGLITAEQYLSKLREIQALRGLVGEGTPSLTNDIKDRLRKLGIPGYEHGTEWVGGNKGVDNNLALISYDESVMDAKTNRKKLAAGLDNRTAIQYAINYKSILDGGFSPLALKDNILPKLEERAAMQYLLNMNTQPIIDELKEVKQTLSKLPLQKFVFDKDGVNQYEQTKNSVKMYRKKRFE